ncbi:AbrB/MazE/SpoVT family DNA-binding domain-containing protein [Bacillus sp. SM2101]|uniref:AbrB/MazE/SpoVT family DNA-binding domain-containing protein n=1 Tax=Bacillus sp. SM2101 TaxID=2805366 RepID=UPI001BDEDC56|nr:AbrB/MazE/SpoVT family DNA-binding domain-containing protein [Bacillus sp. SM2101]
MKFRTGKLTQEGQVTIPIEARNNLNLEEGDRLVIRSTDSTPSLWTIEVEKKIQPSDYFGSLKPKNRRVNPQKEREMTYEQRKLDYIKKHFND